MYKVNLDGSISCETAEEALKLQRLMLQRQSPQRNSAAMPAINGQSIARQFLEKLRPHDGKEVDSAQLAKIVGAETRSGVGPKLRHLRAALEHESISLDSYLRGHKSARGTMTWTVKLPQGDLPFPEKTKD